MWAALTALATAFAEYLRLRQLTAAYDLSRRIEADIAADETDIARLRDAVDDLSARRADRLRARILRACGIASRLNLPTPSPAAGSGAGNTDGGGDVHAADGGGMAQRPGVPGA